MEIGGGLHLARLVPRKPRRHDMPVHELSAEVGPPLRPAGCCAGHDRRTLRNQIGVGKGGLQAHIRGGYEPVGAQENVRKAARIGSCSRRTPPSSSRCHRRPLPAGNTLALRIKARSTAPTQDIGISTDKALRHRTVIPTQVSCGPPEHYRSAAGDSSQMGSSTVRRPRWHCTQLGGRLEGDLGSCG